MYHVFTHHKDAYFEDYDQAKALFDLWADEYGCARLYAGASADENGDNDTDGECIEAVGEYPA